MLRYGLLFLLSYQSFAFDCETWALHRLGLPPENVIGLPDHIKKRTLEIVNSGENGTPRLMPLTQEQRDYGGFLYKVAQCEGSVSAGCHPDAPCLTEFAKGGDHAEMVYYYKKKLAKLKGKSTTTIFKDGKSHTTLLEY